MELLTPYPGEMIERAFEDYLREAEYPRMPVPKEILDRVRGKLREHKEQYEREERKRQERENKERRTRGELSGLADVITLFKKIVEAKALPPQAHSDPRHK